MPPTPKLSAKPSPTSSTSQPKALMLTPPFLPAGGCDDDDDDDFQSPLRPHRARPLKPSNGAASRRPRKKPRTSSSGKENRPVAGGAASEERVAVEAVAGAGTLALGARGCSGDVPEEKDATGSLKGKLSCGIGICTGKSCSNLMGLGFLDTDAPCDLGCRDGDEAQEVGSRVCSSVPEERHAVLKAERCGLPSKEKNWSDSGACKGNYHLNLIELGFPELDASCQFGVADHKEERELGSTVYSSVSEERNAEMEDKVPSQFETKENECSGFGVHEANCHLNSIESELLESNAQYGFGGGHCDEAQEIGLCACNLVSEEMNVVAEDCVTPEVVISEKKSSVFEACKGSYCLNSIESKLLESSVNCSLQGDDFEIGTQLGELINLCMKDDVEGDSKSRASPLQGNKMVREMFESDCQVECPMCGSDISDLSEELRQMHTNDCLDKDEPAQETNSNNEIKSHASGENVENRRVVEWLRNLGLSRYEEVFVREEVDWETLHWLTEEDLLGMGITSLGPRKKIIHALGDLRKKDHVNDVEANVLNSSNTDKSKLPMTANKLITEYFPCSPFNKRRACKLSKPSNLNSRKNSSANKATSRSCAGKGKVKGIPCWCRIPGTPFLVDAFRFLRGDCCHWFLTHFHLDHYQGLTRSFCHGKIYCSSITACLVNHKIGVPWDRLHVLPLNQKITIAGVNLTCFDANHCPGSIIILFEPPNGKAVLHTGDFRFSSEMANNPVLQSCHIHTLILDTTYCNPRYDFPSQETVIQFVIEAIQAEAFNPKTLFLIGSYTIGKERLFMEVARLLQKKIYVGAAKLQILKRLELPEEVMHWFTENEMESHIHVVPMWTLASFKRMKHLSEQYTDRFELIVAFSPTGWTFGKGRKKTPGRRWQQGIIIRYEVPYSEHSSFTELREFVKFISPEHIIPSVNNDGLESADTMLAQLSSDSQNPSNCPS